jgi:polyisoprenoid-binding protein YceI
MRKSFLYPLLLVPALVAWHVTPTPMRMEAGSRLWVKGTSSVRGFECQAGDFTAQVASAGTDAVAMVLAGQKGVDGVQVTVTSKALDCRNGTMNGHMLKAIKADEFPTITFALATYELEQLEGATKVAMQGTLTLGGVAKEIEVMATAKAGPDNTLLVSGTHALNMTDYGLKPPSLMLGTMKVHNKLTVGFELILAN